MKLIVECIPDTILMKSLGIPSKRIYHAGSKGRVIKNVERGIGIGIIDEDPEYTQPKVLSKFMNAKNSNTNKYSLSAEPPRTYVL